MFRIFYTKVHSPPVDNPLVSFVMMHAQSTESPAIFWRGVWDLASDLGEKSPVTEQPSFSFFGTLGCAPQGFACTRSEGGGGWVPAAPSQLTRRVGSLSRDHHDALDMFQKDHSACSAL